MPKGGLVHEPAKRVRGLPPTTRRRFKSDRFPSRRWCQRADLNRRPKAYESSALPTELLWQLPVIQQPKRSQTVTQKEIAPTPVAEKASASGSSPEEGWGKLSFIVWVGICIAWKRAADTTHCENAVTSNLGTLSRQATGSWPIANRLKIRSARPQHSG